MFSSSGILRYSTDPIKLSVEVDQDILRYYYSLLPKFIKINRPMYQAHISVVRNINPPVIFHYFPFYIVAHLSNQKILNLQIHR